MSSSLTQIAQDVAERFDAALDDGTFQDGVRIIEAALLQVRQAQRDEMMIAPPMADGRLLLNTYGRRCYEAGQQAQREWQPIKTCPGPGTTVLLWGGGWRSPFSGWSLGDFGHCWIDGDPGFEMWGATHWMPMPASPLATLRSPESQTRHD